MMPSLSNFVIETFGPQDKCPTTYTAEQKEIIYHFTLNIRLNNDEEKQSALKTLNNLEFGDCATITWNSSKYTLKRLSWNIIRFA